MNSETKVLLVIFQLVRPLEGNRPWTKKKVEKLTKSKLNSIELY